MPLELSCGNFWLVKYPITTLLLTVFYFSNRFTKFHIHGLFLNRDYSSLDLSNAILSGEKLSIPKQTPIQVAQIIQACFESNPKKRPDTSKIFQTLAQIVPNDPLTKLDGYKLDVTDLMAEKIQDVFDSTIFVDP